MLSEQNFRTVDYKDDISFLPDSFTAAFSKFLL